MEVTSAHHNFRSACASGPSTYHKHPASSPSTPTHPPAANNHHQEAPRAAPPRQPSRPTSTSAASPASTHYRLSPPPLASHGPRAVSPLTMPGTWSTSPAYRAFLLLCCPAELGRLRRVAVHEDVLGVDDACYHSGVAAGRTMEVITLIRARLPSVDEVIFVSPSEDSGRRLQMQVETAMRDQGEDTLRCMVVLEGAE